MNTFEAIIPELEDAFQSGVGETFSASVSGNKIFQDGQTFAEIGSDGSLDDFAAEIVRTFDEHKLTRVIVDVRANGDSSFVFGSAIKHPHPLVLGNYSVHTNAQALARGEAEIRRIGQQLRAEGRL